MSSALLAQLAALCRAHPLEPKAVFVPSVQAAQNLGVALAARGPAWANLRLVTPVEWAEYWAGPSLQAAGWQPLSQDEEFFLVWEALALAGRPRALGSADRPSPGLARSLVLTLRILRLNGVSPEGLAALDPAAERLQTLASLHNEYGAVLEKRKRYDQAILFARALKQPRPSSMAVIGVCGELMLPELPFQFIQSCIEVNAYRLGWHTSLAEPSAQSAGARFAALPQPPFPESWQTTPPQIQTCQVTGAEAEVRCVLRMVLRNKNPFDQVELVYTAEQPYLGLIHSLAEEFDLEIDAAQGVPVYLSQPGQALLGFYRWIGSGFDPMELGELCRAGLIRALPETGPVQWLTPFLRRAQAQVENVEREHEDMLPIEKASTADAVLRAQELLKRLKGLVPEGAEVTLSALAEAGVRFLEHCAPFTREHDRRVMDSLVARLRALAIVESTDTPSRLAQRLLDRLGAHHFGAAGAREGHLLISSLESASYAGRKYLYILGMDDGAFPAKTNEDPLLGDPERLRLGLPLQRNRPMEQAWQLSRLLASAAEHLTLVTKRCELQDGRELSPAPLMQRLAEHGELKGIPLVCLDPKEAIDQGEALLAGCLEQQGAGQAQLLFPWLAKGEHACREREHSELGRFSGWLDQLTPELGINRGQLLRSPSSLEALMRCPYSYFLRYVLELVPPADREEDPNRWLDPATLGSALHTLFYRFMSTLKERGQQPCPESHAQLMEGMLQELVVELKERTPVRRESAFRADLRRLERSAGVFLKVESRNQHTEKINFELSFGLGAEGDAHFGEGVVLDLSDRVQLRLQGRIDRVDRQGEAYEIWDYKTGSSMPYEGEDLLRGGLHLQWALYAYALEQVLRHREHGGEVVSSGYFFVGAREHGRRLNACPPEPAVLGRLLGPVVDMMEVGGFFHIQKEKQCTYCDFAALCAGEERLPADLDPALPGQPEIAALLRLWADG